MKILCAKRYSLCEDYDSMKDRSISLGAWYTRFFPATDRIRDLGQEGLGLHGAPHLVDMFRVFLQEARVPALPPHDGIVVVAFHPKLPGEGWIAERPIDKAISQRGALDVSVYRGSAVGVVVIASSALRYYRCCRRCCDC